MLGAQELGRGLPGHALNAPQGLFLSSCSATRATLRGKVVDTEQSATGQRAAAPDQPRPLVGAGERIANLDFIRGLAVMGILAANIVSFGQPFSAYVYPESFLTAHGPLSDQLWIAQFVLIDGKMRGLFTLLFGAGIYLFMERAWAKGATLGLQVRRLAFLLLFGLVHYFFIWRGDILTYYALTGLLALLFVKMTAKTQLVIGLSGYLAGALFYAAMMVPLQFIADTPLGERPELAETREALEQGKADALSDDAIENELKIDGDYFELVAHNFAEHFSEPLINVGLLAIELLPLMLIGMALYRMGLFSGGLDSRRQRLWGWLGLVVGGLLSWAIALWAQTTGFSYYGTIAALMGMSPIPRLLMVLGLCGLLALWGARAGGWLAQRISAAGRAAFTNYLGTSVLMMLVFHGWAGGLFGQLSRPQLYLVTLGAWLLMLAWSKPWLERFRYGPLEWLWRCLTYGRVFALRR